MKLVETVGGPAFDHEIARTAIAYQIGRDRPDEAIQIIEGHEARPVHDLAGRGVRLAGRGPGAARPARANSLIDRALAMMIDERDWAGLDRSGGEMAGAAHVALCARRIGYPDMESVVMRVIAARPTGGRNASGERTSMGRAIAVSTVSLALVDPGAARTVLEQLESRAGFDLAAEWSTREPWLIAWALVDLRKARALRVHSGLARSAEGSQPLEHRLLRNGRAADGPARSPRGDSRPTRRRGTLAAGRGALECFTIGSCPCEITPPGPPFVRAEYWTQLF